jgi:hypothetical protein
MGSPVSVVVANLAMEHVKELVMSTFPKNVRFWKRYVADICCSLHGNEVSMFLLPSVPFTCKVEQGHVLPFLDVLLKHNPDGTITTSDYHKLTHTKRYLDYPIIPSTHKSAVVRTLLSRVEALSSSSVCREHKCSKIFTATTTRSPSFQKLAREPHADLAALNKRSRPL